MILRTLGVIGLAAALASCAAGPRGATGGDAARTVDFECDGGEAFSVRFLPAESAAVLVRGGDEIRLQQQPAASGFLYLHGPTAIRGKGDELTLEIGRRVPLHCTAVR
ncbi:MAG: MliC family protein [Pseudomonadota bacterium]|jgi:membrane-bound inhibitor of C-type lysozyme